MSMVHMTEGIAPDAALEIDVEGSSVLRQSAHRD
jgi:hypothetical protein